MDWYYIDEVFLNNLRLVESRIPETDYGRDKWKPFFGILFTIGDLAYVTNISSPKPRHSGMKNDLDFIKVYDVDLPDDDSLIAVINLNYMFPVPKKYLQQVDYAVLTSLISGKSSSELSKYWDFLQKELTIINTLDLGAKALRLYNLVNKYKNSKYALRSFDFSNLENVVKTMA